MVVIEMRDAAYDNAFELLDEAKHSAKKTKLTLCELEDAMYDCYEASKENKESDEYEEDAEMGLRNAYARRDDYRHDDQYGVREEDDDEMNMRSGMRRMSRRSRAGMRMRRNRMGRFV
ncbi:hypothetical protein [Segatella bryantii]|uniref:hypothetical protein n=1 Tax=Segatella bryantii TaxID=77095 RepID=UPI00242CC9AF|nr:hypothetical protein [Segatella bryantii]